MRIIENGKKGGKIHNFFITLTWDEKPGMKRPLSILPCCRSVDLDGSKRQIRCSRDKSWEKIWPFAGSKKVVKTRWKLQIFHEWALPKSKSKKYFTDRRRKISWFWFRDQKNTFLSQMTSYEGSGLKKKLFCFSYFFPFWVPRSLRPSPPLLCWRLGTEVGREVGRKSKQSKGMGYAR